MLFMYISTHTPDYCMAGEPQVQMKVIEPVREGFQRAGVKVIGAYSCPPELPGWYPSRNWTLCFLRNYLDGIAKRMVT
jgi:hypothetical protein